MNEIMTSKQVAERLQVKPSWVYEQTRERAGIRNLDPFPHIKLGRYLRFDWADVLQWVERHKIPAGNGAVRSQLGLKH